MPSRGRHQTTSKECKKVIDKIESMDGVVGVIIGRSYGGKSLGQNSPTGRVKIQRPAPGGLKAVTQTAKGVQELFIRTDSTRDATLTELINRTGSSGAP